MSARLSEPSGLDDLLLYKLSRLLAVGGSMVIRLEGAIATLQQQAETMVHQAQLPKADRRRGSRPRLEMG